jgi:hypothetical protein
MLRLLLDEQISPKIAAQARKLQRDLDIISLREWEGGSFLGVSDVQILRAAAGQNRTLVTYDQRTMWRSLQSLAEEEMDHGGVIFIDDKTIRQDDYGAIIRGLCFLSRSRGTENWTNKIVFLKAARRTQ